ncbi:MAG TPA: IclR family transcriptional regulator [Streptosporangiaceae bacterium]|nr:IclR family transcriptional regulator [Streptosporangiaceae bacterium]
MTAGSPAGIEGAETARRAGRLMEIVATAGRPAPLEWIGEQAGLSKSTAYRLLRALQDEGWLERAGRAGYQAGPRLIRLAAAIDPGHDITERARPWLESLASVTAETASLNVRDGNWAVTVTGAESTKHALHRAVQVGHRMPLARGCTGLAILAWLPAAEQEQAARELAAGEYISQADVDGLGRRLSTIARDGFVRSSEENHPGLAAVAAPVFMGTGGPVVGSIAVGGPVGRWTREAIDASVPDLLRACAELSASLAETQAAASAARAALRGAQ